MSCVTDCRFLLTMIQDFKALLTSMRPGVFDSTVTANITYDTIAKQTDTIELTLGGTVAFLYRKFFKVPYPMGILSTLTPVEIGRINAIWEGIGHPENKLPV